MPGDTDAFTTAIGESENWRKALQARVSLKIQLESYIPGITTRIEAALKESSVLIYEQALNKSLSTDAGKVGVG